MRGACVLLSAFLSCLSVTGVTQQPAPRLTARPQESAVVANGNPQLISLDVVVTNKSGKPIAGLEQKDFSILDDKRPQPILSFQSVEESSNPPNPPLQVILLVDAVNASYQQVAFERLELAKLLARDNGHLSLPTSLAFLTDTTTRIQPHATQDGNALVEELNSNQSPLRAITRSQGFYGAGDRIQVSIDALQNFVAYEEKQPGRKLLIWISPGWPLLSGAGVQLTQKNRESIFSTIVTLSTDLRGARITLYSVDPLGMSDAGSSSTFFYEAFLKGVSSLEQVYNGDLALQVLASQSGGRVLNSSNDVASLIASCLSDAKAFYTISFESPKADHPDEYHSVQVKVDKPGLTARTRTGYYAQP